VSVRKILDVYDSRHPLIRTPRMSGAPSITVSALSRDTSSAEGFAFDFPFVEGFAFGVAFAFCSCHQGPLAESRGGSFGSTSHLFGHCTSDHDSLFRLPAPPGGKALHQPNGDLLLHQGGPRAALHANQLRVIHLATQHPVHPHRQFPGDGDFRHAAATTQPEPLIVLP